MNLLLEGLAVLWFGTQLGMNFFIILGAWALLKVLSIIAHKVETNKKTTEDELEDYDES